MRNIAFSFIFLLPAAVFSQKSASSFAPFAVDTAVLPEVQRYSFEVLGQMDVNMYQNDTLLFTTFDSTNKQQILVFPTWVNDTLEVLGNAGMFQGYGFLLCFSQKECQIFNRISVEMAPIFKLQAQDTTYRAGLQIPCTSARLTLSAQPRYEAGEQIFGIVELSGVDFFEKKRRGEGDNRYRMDLKAYFQFAIPAR